jgi:hypothetical protein
VLIVRALAACPIGQLDRQPHSPANQQNESNCVEGCQVSPHRRDSGAMQVSAPFAGFLSVRHFARHERKSTPHFKGDFRGLAPAATRVGHREGEFLALCTFSVGRFSEGDFASGFLCE